MSRCASRLLVDALNREACPLIYSTIAGVGVIETMVGLLSRKRRLSHVGPRYRYGQCDVSQRLICSSLLWTDASEGWCVSAHEDASKMLSHDCGSGPICRAVAALA
jgi:hypothetical protein